MFATTTNNGFKYFVKNRSLIPFILDFYLKYASNFPSRLPTVYTRTVPTSALCLPFLFSFGQSVVRRPSERDLLSNDVRLSKQFPPLACVPSLLFPFPMKAFCFSKGHKHWAVIYTGYFWRRRRPGRMRASGFSVTKQRGAARGLRGWAGESAGRKGGKSQGKQGNRVKRRE